MDTNFLNKKFFLNNFIIDVFLFFTAIISLLVTALAHANMRNSEH